MEFLFCVTHTLSLTLLYMFKYELLFALQLLGEGGFVLVKPDHGLSAVCISGVLTQLRSRTLTAKLTVCCSAM